MKASELIKELQALEGDPEVWLSRDPEGNGFHKYQDHSKGYINPDEEDNILDAGWSADDAMLTLSEWAAIKENAKKVVVLWP